MPKPKDNEYMKLKVAALLVYEMTGVHRSHWSLKKWASHGRIGSDGKMVKLRISKRLGTSYTTRKWLEKFIRAVG